MRSLLLVAIFLASLLPWTAAAEEVAARELSLEQAVTQALENNPAITVQRLTDESVGLALRELELGYEPSLSSLLQTASQREPAQDAFTGGTLVKTDSRTWSIGLTQPLTTGGAVRLDMFNSRLGTDSVYSTFNPGFASKLQLGLVQPLLRDFRIDERRRRIRVARRNREISDLAFRELVLNTTAEVKLRYFDLLFALDLRDAQAQILERVTKLQEDNRERVRAGVLPRFDLLLGDSELAARQEALMVADATRARAEDALKYLVVKGGDLEAWKTRIHPTDRPAAEPVTIDVDAALRAALANRTDLKAARAGLARSEIVRQLARNETLPAVDLAVTYGSVGVGGTGLIRNGLGGEVTQEIPGGYGDALSDAFARRYPSWAVGLNLTYPILNRSARTGLTRARVDRDLAAARIAQLEQAVIVEVRDAARSVEIGYARVQRAREALAFQKQRLDAEMERYAAGRSSPFFVIQAQRDLVISELTELNAVTDYRKNLVRFERAQAAGLSAEGFLE